MTTAIEIQNPTHSAATPAPTGHPETGARDGADLQLAWIERARALGRVFATRSAEIDATDEFVEENYEDLRRERFFSALVPIELGGGGATFNTMCACLTEIARHCASTALALSMHQHLVAANVWKYRKQGQSEAMLRMVAEKEIVLVSTGGSDWIDSSGEAVAVEGGFRVSGRKIFGSGGPAGAVLVTSARYEDPEEGTLALHFPVPMSAEGVERLDTWRAHGMRGTGSHDIMLKDVFVPSEKVAVRRPAGVWHPSFDVVTTMALPIIMNVYLGIAEAASREATARCEKRSGDRNVQQAIGEMGNELEIARMAVSSMTKLAEDGTAAISLDRSNAIAQRKAIATRAVIRTVELAVEAVGGAAFYRTCPLERMLRDVRAAHFHPMQQRRQLEFSGRIALGLDPVTGVKM